MSTRTLFTQYPEAQEFLKAHDAEVVIAVKNADGLDVTYELPDGSLWQEHDQNGEPYTLDMLKGADDGR